MSIARLYTHYDFSGTAMETMPYSQFLINNFINLQKQNRMETIKLTSFRAELKEQRGTVSQCIKVLYSYTDTCNELKKMLKGVSKNDAVAFLGSLVYAEMNVGGFREVKRLDKTTMETKVVKYAIKPSVDMVLRYFVKHQNELTDLVKTAKSAKAAKSAE